MRSKDNFDSDGKFKKVNWKKENTPRYWLKNNPVLSYIGNVYIIVTAEIERFAIQAIKEIHPQIKDAALYDEIDIFIKEEMAHAYHHTSASNDLLRHDYPVKFITKYSRGFFNLCSSMTGVKGKIALVFAMEFFAHEMSVAVLRHNLFPKNKLAIFDFLWWHAHEELSHSNLCFRLYNYFNCGYFRRIFSLNLISLFSIITLSFTPHLFFIKEKCQGRKIKIKYLFSTIAFFFGRKGILWKHFKPYFKYFLPTFHPDDLIPPQNIE